MPTTMEAPPTDDIKEQKLRALTAKERLCADAYLETSSYMDAGRKCGWPDNQARQNAYRIINRPPVQAYIQQQIATVNKEITPEKIKVKINDLADNAKKEDTRLRALELLGRAVGMFIDRTVTDVSVVAILGDALRPTVTTIPVEARPSDNNSYVNYTAEAIPSTDEVVPIAPSTVEAIHPVEDAPVESPATVEAATPPQPPLDDSNTASQKISTQNEGLSTSEAA